MALTARTGLLTLLGAGVVGLLWPSGAAVLLITGLLLLGGIVDLVLAPNVRSLILQRDGDTAVRLGERAVVSLVIANPGSRRVRAQVRDAWPPSAGALQDRHRVDIPPGERRRVTTILVPTRRGDRPAAGVAIRAVGPLGLAARQGSHQVPWTVRVLPGFASRRHLPGKLARLRELDGQTAVLVRGQGSEFDSLREYVTGDDVRSIDWRATARAADVVVRTWRPERDRQIVLVLDTGRTSAGRVGDAPRLDAAMDAALLLAALASRAGDRVDLLAYDRRLRAAVQGTTSADLLPSLVTAMATLQPELVESDAHGLVSMLLARVPRRCLVVLFSGLDAAAVEEGLLSVLPALTRRHQVVLAAVADPRVEAMTGGRGDVDAVYGAAAAERARAERRHVITALSRRGVEVVDEPPDALPPRLADTYLALKAAGRL